MEQPVIFPSPPVYTAGPQAAAVATQLRKETAIQHAACPNCGTPLLVIVSYRRSRYGFATAHCSCGRAFTGWLA